MPKKMGSVRVISGAFKSRKISFPQDAMIRPSGDRIKESLFSWLQAEVVESNCLDLFAGSGALGIECLSRGAKRVTFVEADKRAALALNENLTRFRISNATVYNIDAFEWLKEVSPENPFSIVFLDPPFGADILPACYSLLEKANVLASECLIYIESDKTIGSDVPPNWHMTKSKKAGSVYYYLYYRNLNK